MGRQLVRIWARSRIYLSAQVSVEEAATDDLFVLTNTFNGLAGWGIPQHIRIKFAVTACVCRLTEQLTGLVVGGVGTHTGWIALIRPDHGFKDRIRIVYAIMM